MVSPCPKRPESLGIDIRKNSALLQVDFAKKSVLILYRENTVAGNLPFDVGTYHVQLINNYFSFLSLELN